jgi:hypothetical protein
VPVIIGDAQLLAHTARTLDLQSGYDIVRRDEEFPEHFSDPIIYHLDNITGSIEPGIESAPRAKLRLSTSKPRGVVRRRKRRRDCYRAD